VQINIHDAETSLSALLDKAIAGEDVVIARAGKPLVPVTAVASKNGVRLEGCNRAVRMTKDFHAPTSDDDLLGR